MDSRKAPEVRKTRAAVKLPFAETYVLISLTAFGLTVVVTRVFLILTGYPQVGNSVLHIAHALWGGLLLFAAALIPLIFANRWAITTSSVLSGIGVGLFIDEVGKFITQKNDYFYAPAAPIIYSALLLVTLLFLSLRRKRQESPRASMYRALSGLREVLDNDLDPVERDRLMSELASGQTAAEPHVKLLAKQLTAYLQDSSIPLSDYRPGIWSRAKQRVRRVAEKPGRKNHSRVIMAAITIVGVQTIFMVCILLWAWLSPAIASAVLSTILVEASELTTQRPIWLFVRLALQLIVGVVYLLSLMRFVQRREEAGLDYAIFASMLSLTAVHLLTFYLNQFGSLTALFSNFALLLLLQSYRSWYLPDR